MPRPGSRQERGYGAEFDRAKRAARAAVKAGGVRCVRCDIEIDPDEAWDLDHDDYDRSIINGPAHRYCNRRAGGIKGNAIRWKRKRIRRWVL